MSDTTSAEETTVTPQKEDTSWYRPVYSWYVVVVLTIAYTLSFIDRQIINLLIGPIKADLGISDFEISLLTGIAFAFFYTILGIPLGSMADRKNRKWIISGGLFLWSLMTMACGFAKNFWTLFLARMGVGVGEATLSPCAYSMISDYFPKEKLARAHSFYTMGIYLGSGLAFILGGWVISFVADSATVVIPLIGEVRSWQAAFIAVGAPGILYLVFIFAIKEPKRRGLVKPEGQNDIGIKEGMAYIMKRKSAYMAIFLAVALNSLQGYGSATWTPEFFVRVHGMERADIAYIFGFMILIFQTSGVLSGGWFADKMEMKGVKDAKIRVALIAAICAVPFKISFGIVDDPTLAIILLAIGSYCLSVPYGVAAAALQMISPNEMRGKVIAVYFFVINMIGLGLGSTVIASFTDFVFMDEMMVGWSMAATAAICLPIQIFILYKALNPYKKLVEKAEQGYSL